MAKQTNTKFDSIVYWLCQLSLAVLATAGAMFFLQPVDFYIRGAITFALVANLLYVAYRNR